MPKKCKIHDDIDEVKVPKKKKKKNANASYNLLIAGKPGLLTSSCYHCTSGY